MKRRDFLKILTAVPVIAAVPVLAKADEGIVISPISTEIDEAKLALWADITEARDTLNNAPVPDNWPDLATTTFDVRVGDKLTIGDTDILTVTSIVK